MNVLRLEGVSRRRGLGSRAVIAVSDVSLALAPGEVVLLQGPSGSGEDDTACTVGRAPHSG